MTLLLISVCDQKLVNFKSTVAAHKVISEFTSVLSAVNVFRDKLIFIIINDVDLDKMFVIINYLLIVNLFICESLSQILSNYQ